MSEKDMPTQSELPIVEPVATSENGQQGLTIAQAYQLLDQLMPNDSFQLEVDVWKWRHMPEGEQLAVTYRCYCVEHGRNHGGQECESLEEVVEAVRRAHPQEPVREGEEQLRVLRDIGELDREQSGRGPNL